MFRDTSERSERAELLIAAGDVVQLRSGGPAMTVRALVGGKAKCEWFSGDEVMTREFLSHSLAKIDRAALHGGHGHAPGSGGEAIIPGDVAVSGSRGSGKTMVAAAGLLPGRPRGKP